MSKQNVYLVGMMGSGKTAVGRALGVFLGWGFLDLDEMIQKKMRQTITQLFQAHGEDYFRNQETLALNEISSRSSQVVATGGGTVLRPANVKRMHETGKIVYLETSLEILWERVKDKTDRPLLQGENPEESLRMIFAVRKPIYENICHFKVTTDSQNVEDVAREILKKWEASS